MNKKSVGKYIFVQVQQMRGPVGRYNGNEDELSKKFEGSIGAGAQVID